MLNKLLTHTLNTANLLTLLTSIMVFLIIIFTRIVISYFPGTEWIDESILTRQTLKRYVFIAYVCGLIGWIISLIQEKIVIKNILQLKLTDYVVYFSISLLFTQLILSETVTTKIGKMTSWVMIILPLSFITSLLIQYYESAGTLFKRSRIRINYRAIWKKVAIPVVFLGGIFVINVFTSVIISTVYGYATGRYYKEKQIAKKTYITHVQPLSSTYSETVILNGYNFGWKTDNSYKLLSRDGEIPSGDWLDNKISFVVPLHLKEGNNEIWIEKKEQNTKKISNKVTLKIIPPMQYFPAAARPESPGAINTLIMWLNENFTL